MELRKGKYGHASHNRIHKFPLLLVYALTFVYRKNVISRDTKVATDLKNTTCTSNIPVYLNVRHTNNDSTLEFDSKFSLILFCLLTL
jgi:hypothetical protein